SRHSDDYPPRADLEAAFQVVRHAKIPQVPDIVLSLRDELRRPEPDLNHAADLIARDLAMTGQVLKTINSPLFATRAKVSSIRQAVTLIGLRQLTNLVTAEAFNRLVDECKGGARLILDFLQEQAHTMASVATLAGLTVDEAYLFGLMQGAGSLIFADLNQDYVNEWTLQALTAPEALMDYEHRAFGTDHVTVGFLLAGTWRLPVAVALAIYHQHAPEPPHQFESYPRALIAVARLTRLLLALRRGIEDNPVLLDQCDWALNELAITPKAWEDWVARLPTDGSHT
ncbi:MAG: HDOD domain-containing protein, partial [Thermochromatium sp.]